MKGLSVTTNPMGFTSVRLHYTADPSKDPFHKDPDVAKVAQLWLDGQRAQWPDPNDFEREYEINFFVGKGTRVFPQFSQALHCRDEIKPNKYKVVYRGWDFGWHCPVCLLAQIDPQGRLLVLRAIVGKEKSTRDFAQSVIEKCGQWFPNHAAGFEDFCDPAGQQVKAMESERNEKRDTEVLEGLGIHAKYEYGWSRKDGRALVHRLLTLRTDGTPGLLVDFGQCHLLAEAALGRYVYPEMQNGRIAEDPDDKTHPWADLMGALRYLVIGLHRKLGLPRMALASSPLMAKPDDNWHGYGTPIN